MEKECRNAAAPGSARGRIVCRTGRLSQHIVPGTTTPLKGNPHTATPHVSRG